MRRGALGLLMLASVIAGGLTLTAGCSASSKNAMNASAGAAAMPGSATKFAYLASEHTNFCQLDAQTVLGYPDTNHMRGSCCNPMDLAKYRSQVTRLRRYSNIPQIPADPYDIQAGLAKQLLRADKRITLTEADKQAYDAAMRMTDDNGPCCCQCWRWYMTEGLDKLLVTQRHMTAPQLAEVTDLVNGCGGR